MPDIVNAVLLRKDEVLLARCSPTRKTYAGRWSFPGGHVEADESFEQALRRELQEEVGIAPLEYRALAPLADPHSTITVYHMYAVTRWTGEPALCDDEHTELRWVPLSAAASLEDLALETYRPMFVALARVARGAGR